MKDLFKPKDFDCRAIRVGGSHNACADIANAKYREWLAKGAVVYGLKDGSWVRDQIHLPDALFTHQARGEVNEI